MSIAFENTARRLVGEFRRRLNIALGLLALALVTGVLGFRFLESHTWLEAFYMTVITLGTVGFGEVHPLSDAGRVFVALLIMFNLGIFAYAITVITESFVDGQFRRMLKIQRMLKRIERLQNHVIICGYGRHGHAVAAELLKAGQPFVVLENRPEALEELREGPLPFIAGDATQDDVLIEAGVKRAGALIVTAGSETDNVYIVLSARQLNPQLHIVSRALNAQSEAKLLRAGADHIVMPERIGGFFMATLVKNPNVVEFLSILSNMGKNSIAFEEVPVKVLRKEFQRRALGEWSVHAATGASIIGLHLPDGEYLVNPPSDIVPPLDSRLIVLGNREQIERFRQKFLPLE
jgi:voltage-gated potassium channel